MRSNDTGQADKFSGKRCQHNQILRQQARYVDRFSEHYSRLSLALELIATFHRTNGGNNNMTILDVLATELQKPEYAGLSDQDAANIINAKRVTRRQLVPTWVVKQHAIENGYFAKISMAATDATIPVEVRGLCVSVIAWIDDQAGKIQSINFDLSSTQAMVAGLIASGIMTQAQATTLQQLVVHQVRWVDEQCIGEVGIGLVINARKQIGVA